MKTTRQELLRIAQGMADRDIGCLRQLRTLVVDMDLTEEASICDSALFLALYLAKRLTGDVWENLATDASFDFNEEDLIPFITPLGEALQAILSENRKNDQIVEKLGELTQWLYAYFYAISQNPGRVQKGGSR